LSDFRRCSSSYQNEMATPFGLAMTEKIAGFLVWKAIGIEWIHKKRLCDMAGVIEVDLFDEEANSLEHPEVVKFKKLLLEVAEEYQCRLVSFEVEGGTVSFAFDSDELMAEILRLLQAKVD
jgi:hypothetical protein